jgi:hypothetical protein
MNSFRCFYIFMEILLFLGLCYGWAQDDPKVSLEVKAGFEGRIRSGNWGPLSVTLTSNQKEPISGVLEVYTSQGTIFLKREIEVSKDSPKHLSLAYPFSYSLSVHFKTDQGVLYKSSPLTLNGLNYLEMLLATVDSSEQTDLNFLVEQLPPAKSGGTSSSLAFHSFDLKELPSHWFAFQALEALLFLEVSRLESLQEVQKKAIKDWVLAGGTLFINGGEGARQLNSSFLGSLLHFEVLSGVEVEDFPSTYVLEEPGKRAFVLQVRSEFQKTPSLGFGGRRSGEVLVETPQTHLPLLLEQQVGNGRLLFSTVDIRKKPFQRKVQLLKYLMRTEFQEEFLKNTRLLETGGYGRESHPLFDYLMSFIPLSFSTFLKLSAFLILYLFALFYNHHYLVRTAKTIEKKIYSVPFFILFLTLIALVALPWVEQTSWKYQIRVDHYVEGSTQGVTEGLVALKWSQDKEVQSVLPQGSAISKVYWANFDPARFEPLSLDLGSFGQPPEVSFSSQAPGTFNTFRWFTLSDTAFPLNAQLRILSPQECEIEIWNRSEEDIETPFLLAENRILPLETLPAKSQWKKKYRFKDFALLAKSQSYRPFRDCFTSEQNKLLIQVLASLLNEKSLLTLKNQTLFHLIGSSKTPLKAETSNSWVQLRSENQGLTFEEEKSWRLIHYIFRPVSEKCFGSETSEEERKGK